MSKETINEHIRNAVSPIVNLISMLESAESDKFSSLDADIQKKLIKKAIESSKKAIEVLLTLGNDSIEPETSEYFKKYRKE